MVDHERNALFSGATFRFGGKVAVVSGTAHGLGRAIALSLARDSARVYGLDVLDNELEETASTASEQGERVTVARVYVTVEAEVDALMGRGVAESGGVQSVVNGAGGVRGQVGRPLEEVGIAVRSRGSTSRLQRCRGRDA